ncbi:DEAD/DEAH box helicase [Peptostreptococcus equinus]|uniref:DEAD/DEAH box helicase n=1 Tax=Peptostreptococcus equinus TaxID=3003601 RepID=A0ABY7JQ50_9FIRM|nr:DEAD/DEAH box helicase [Peptostreptococcus sp. CBA3647]WAW15474.1 DEAD/DEAH box helicase [Peptostreptococcus sp. CBA3647]
MHFSNLKIDNNIINALSKNGIKEPTQIQSETMYPILNLNNIIAKSNTGSGKTLAFVIPILNLILNDKIETSLILAPTREITIQISQVIESLVNVITNIDKHPINYIAIYGGKDIKSQIKKLNSNKINIIIATPGRLLDHIQRKTIKLDMIDTLVIDEADQMLLMGFKNEIDSIFNKINTYKNLLLFSATINSSVKKLAYRYAENFIEIDTSKENIPNKIEQEFIISTDRSKFDDLCKQIEKDSPFLAIIFCRTKARVDNLDIKLGQKGYSCCKIHSDISQSKRERIIKDFKNMKFQFLISTDLASRGLDIQGLSHIYNYDFPELAQDYIHRIGRTGRVNKDGKSRSFITEKNMLVYEEVKKILE